MACFVASATPIPRRALEGKPLDTSQKQLFRPNVMWQISAKTAFSWQDGDPCEPAPRIFPSSVIKHARLESGEPRRQKPPLQGRGGGIHHR